MPAAGLLDRTVTIHDGRMDAATDARPGVPELRSMAGR